MNQQTAIPETAIPESFPQAPGPEESAADLVSYLYMCRELRAFVSERPGLQVLLAEIRDSAALHDPVLTDNRTTEMRFNHPLAKR